MNKLVLSDENETVIYMDNYKIIKVREPTIIYPNQIRSKCGDIYINSVSVESVNHTKDYVYYPKWKNNINKLTEMYDDIHHAIKTTMYLTPRHCHQFNQIKNTFYNKSKSLNRDIYFCSHHNTPVFGHCVAYFFPLIYFYYLLKQQIPELLLVISYETDWTRMLLKILDIRDYMVIRKHEIIENKGTTYFAGELTVNLSFNIMNDFYYDLIVKQTILNYPIKDNTSSLPKKILFLRHANNIKSPGLISNRSEIINLTTNYGYVDIDQTKLSIEYTIHLLNNATHIILETGGSMLHLLWSKNIKAILLSYRPIYFDTCACLYPDANPILKLISDNALSDIAKYKNATIIQNDDEYIKTNVLTKECYLFTQMDKLQTAIENNE